MGIIYSTKPLPERRDYDFYPTPPELCKAVYEANKINVNGKDLQVLDAGAGDGVWGNVLRTVNQSAIVTGVELRELPKPEGYDIWYTGTDFLKFEDKKYDLVIGNPPYKFAEEFIRKAMEVVEDYGVVIFLLRLSFLESKKRYEGLFTEFRPIDVSVSVRRVSFSGNKKSDNTAYAVYKWLKGYNKSTGLNWLDWSYD